MKRKKILIGAAAAVILVLAYCCGVNAPVYDESEKTEIAQQTPVPKVTDEPIATATPSVTPMPTTEPKHTPKATSEPEKTPTAAQPKTEEAAVSPMPAAAMEAEIYDKKLTCTMSVRCDTALKNADAEKMAVLPPNGVILAEQTVSFYEGESVFNLLLREMKRNKIHMEYTNMPGYNSAYIEGINNLYELDCGDLSGWMYCVNGWFPNYGCSRYLLEEGDRVEWVYTCSLGADVGGAYSARNGR